MATHKVLYRRREKEGGEGGEGGGGGGGGRGGRGGREGGGGEGGEHVHCISKENSGTIAELPPMEYTCTVHCSKECNRKEPADRHVHVHSQLSRLGMWTMCLSF